MNLKIQEVREKTGDVEVVLELQREIKKVQELKNPLRKKACN